MKLIRRMAAMLNASRLLADYLEYASSGGTAVGASGSDELNPSEADVRDRDRLRGEHLRRLGWSFHRLWPTNWCYDAKAEVTKLRDAYDRAVAAADQAAPPPAQEPVPPPVQQPAPGADLDLSGPPEPVTRSSP